ncbi:halocyanin domain-containing protein [Halorubrum aquaticum]|uniref:Halocyanin domain-containing protein n=1 Tax=Halorubrum aquaticum TaxID=387340 RepID=A0A1I3ABH3_9EURY|nr:halocyanin domain-containing protein [Halorubrum aquaticum]SFH47444.1 halocyanin domain-containing protein [Halorubrum aquaticum]
MDGFEGPVEGRNGTWSVGDRVGRTPRWTTYHGTDEEGNPVAIRTPTGKVPSDRFDRFDALARQWATVDERRTVRGLRDWGTDPRPWVAVEYVPDELEAWATGTTLETARACDPRTRAELLFDVCEVLRTYSRYGSTPCHLALHPDCLSFRVDADGPVAVVDDWGLSRLVEDPPTTPYTAPEQLEGDHASKRTDVYRIGALAAAALGDGSPFPNVDADDPAALAAAIRGGIDVDGLSADLPEGAVRPIRRATESDPADRYATTYPLGRDLLDAVPTVDTGDREADALAATVAPTPEEPGDDGAATEDDDAGAGDDGTEDDGRTTGGAAAAGTAAATADEAAAADTSGKGGDPSGDGTPGGSEAGDADDAGGSRRSFLKYGVGAFALAGVGLGGLVAMERNGQIDATPSGGTASTGGSGSDGGTGSPADPYDGWLDGVENYDGTYDYRGRDVVVVEVGAGENGLRFAPAAVLIDPGTTVVWEWTGRGGAHNVVATDETFDNGETVNEAGYTFEHTFEDAGEDVFNYLCVPHEAVGMKGAVAVGDVDDDLVGPDEGDADAEVTGGTVTVDVRYYQWLEGLPEAIADSDVPDAVDVEVRSNSAGDGRLEEFVDRVDAGDPKPDVFVVNGWELGRLFSAGATEPLSRHANRHRIGEVLDGTFPALDTAARHPGDGAVHALPYSFMPQAVVYRRPRFREAGFDDEGWMTEPPTWADWSRMVATVRRDAGFVWSGRPSRFPSTFTGVLAGFGGSYYETTETAPANDAEVTIADTPGVRAANVLHDLALGGDRADPPVERTSSEAVLEFGFGETMTRFLDGGAVAALLPLSVAVGRQDRIDSEALGVMPMPTGAVGSRTALYGQYVVVNPNTELLGEALAVARGFRSSAVGSLLVENGQLPTMNGDPFSLDAAASPYEPYAPAIRFMAENGVLDPPTEVWYRDRSAIGEALRHAVTDDPEAGLSEVAAILDE